MLPAQVQVKISSEAAGSIAIAGVSVQTLAIRDLIEQMLGITGKDPARIQEILRRGSLVSGESRLRWDPFEVAATDLGPVLAGFPDSEPGRSFDAPNCFHVLLIAGRERVDVPRSVAAKRKLFRRRTFWDAVTELAHAAPPEYVEYSYRLRCDHYRIRLNLERLALLGDASALLAYDKLANRIRSTAFDTLELFVRRGS